MINQMGPFARGSWQAFEQSLHGRPIAKGSEGEGVEYAAEMSVITFHFMGVHADAVGNRNNQDDHAQDERQRAAEFALRASEERNRLALQAAGMGTWEWDVIANVQSWSPETEALSGLAPGTFDGTSDAFRRTIQVTIHQLTNFTNSLIRGRAAMIRAG